MLLAGILVAPHATRAETVRVRIFEDPPTPWQWQFDELTPADTFPAPAMGWVAIPAKHNARGMEIDRSNPFVLHAETTLDAPQGEHRLILRARGAARLIVDGRVLAETDPARGNSSAHERVPELVEPEDPRWSPPPIGTQQRIVTWTSDGSPSRVELWVLIGGQRLRPETGELSVSLVGDDGLPRLIGSSEATLTDEGWEAFAEAEQDRIEALNTERRRQKTRGDDPYWRQRHEQARGLAPPPALPDDGQNLVDRHLRKRLEAEGVAPSPRLDDAAFFRRLALDTIGVVPAPEEVEAFLADPRPDKRARAIDQRLADPRWADAWMGYWQDVLAENPGLLKPTLNNTGPFRRFLYQALLDNKPIDRFVTELIRMEGSPLGGGPAGFGVATENDAPMAAKAHILAKAFQAAEMTCARCHDAPAHPYAQADLFELAAMLDNQPQTIPETSTVTQQPGGRTPAVTVSLSAGDEVEPRWSLPEFTPEDDLDDDLLSENADQRERLAAYITSPRNERFAPVVVNRLWQRFLGFGLVEPVDNWDDEPIVSEPALLNDLARELMTHNYDLKHVARVILNSRVYQSEAVPAPPASSTEPFVFAGPVRRRMSAEQLLDSLFAVAGKPFRSEVLSLDPDGRRPAFEFLNLGHPRRAWQFAAISNERDRPALSLPIAQGLTNLLETFGWRAARPDPITVREEATTALQPALLANGVVSATRIARLSDDSAFTELCLEDQTAEELIRKLYLRILSRTPSEGETARLVNFLGDAFASRLVPDATITPPKRIPRRVTWSNHLSPEATEIQLQMEQLAREGDPPTQRLTPEFRERMEDIVWALINSPEFAFLP